ncbi:MAG: hypothetical protein ACXVPN_09385 [Bacteroidia bacterium]
MLTEKNKNILNKFLPYALILTCLVVLSRFFIDTLRFTIQADDFMFLTKLQGHSVWEASMLVLQRSNGRWFSHFYTCLVFSILKTNWSVYFIYDIIIFLVLVVSIFCFFLSFMRAGLISSISNPKNWLLSFFTASVFFLFLIDGRYEVFYWVSSISNHLLSIIFFLFSLTVIISKPGFYKMPLLLILSFCIAQMNEIYVISYLLVYAFMWLSFPQTKNSVILVFTVVVLGLILNICSAGAAARINEAAPDFSIVQSVKNVTTTFALPLINYRYLPIKIAALLLLIFSLRNYFKLSFATTGRHFHLFNRLLFLFAIAGVFAQCYLLRMVCPYRSLLVYSLCLVYFLFVMAVKGTINPLKLFF